jgi:mono/diheme cytochrome c family protein
MRGIPALVVVGFLALPGPVPQETVPPADPEPDRQALERGAQLYSIYCKGCHGTAGRGDGPAAFGIDPHPSDLTRLRDGNRGDFPTARVIMGIDGRTRIPGHEGGQMPIFGLSLQESASDANQEPQVREKIQDLVAYLRSIQRPMSD